MRWQNPVDLRAAATAAACVSLCFFAVPEANAGPLGKVTKSISNQTGSSKGRSGGGGGGSKTQDSRSSKSNNSAVDVGVGGCYTCAPVATASAAVSAGARKRRPPTRPNIDLYLGGHRVKDSDGAITGMIRVRHSGFAVEFSDASYFERRPTLMDEDDRIRMDVWSLNVQARVAHVERTRLWVIGGLGVAGSSEFESLHGPVLGGRLVHDIAPGLATEGLGRYLFLEDGVSAMELRATIRASVLSVGYRRLEFNVGPPLHGPEVGVSLTF